MNEHVCLLYLADKLDSDKLQEFFYRICTVRGYPDDKIMSYGLLYASQYHLFGGEPISAERLKELKRLASCASCAKVCGKREYKGFQIERNACQLCRLSSSYLNAREEKEALWLGHALQSETDPLFCFTDPSSAFCSVERLCKDYAFGRNPIVPFHLYLYQFLDTTPDFRSLQKETFLANLMDYIRKQVVSSNNQTCVGMDDAAVSSRIEILLDGLYRISVDHITDDLLASIVSDLSDNYSYEPPMPALKPSKTKKLSPKSKSASISSQLDLFDLLSGEEAPSDVKQPVGEEDPAKVWMDPDCKTRDPQSDTAVHAASCVSDSYTDSMDPLDELPGLTDYGVLPDSGSVEIDDSLIPPSAFEGYEDSTPDKTQPVECENPVDVSPGDVVISDSDEKDLASLLQDVSGVADTSDTSPEAVKSESMNDSLDKKVANISVLDTFLVIDGDDTLYDAVQPIFSGMAFEFSADVIRSSFVSVEPALRGGREGLLIYTRSEQKFYYYDIQLYGCETLDSLFFDSELEVYTANTLGLIYLFCRYGSSFENFYALDVLSCLKQKKGDLATARNGLSFNNMTYKQALPIYRQELVKIKSDNCEKLMHRMVKAYFVLFRSYDLSPINEVLAPSFRIKDYTQFSFCSFEQKMDGLEVHLPGTLYCLSLNGKRAFDMMAPSSFAADVLLVLSMLPREYQRHTYVLGMKADKLLLFYYGDQGFQQFFDLFLANVQKAYYKRYNAPLSSSSYCVEYEPAECKSVSVTVIS